MPSLEVVSHVLLWIVVILQGVFLLALARQIGLFHERFAAGGARIMNVGLNIGESAPTLNATDTIGYRVTLGVERGKRTLLFFISTGCSTCAFLMPDLKRLGRAEADNLEIKLVAFGTTFEAGQKYVLEHALTDAKIPFIVSDDLALRYKVSLAPYGVMIDRSGIVRSKGLINSRFDIESLLNAEEMGVRSIQQYSQAQKAAQSA